VCRTDRMGALGRSQGARFELHPPTVGFAAHHGTTIASCKAGDAKRKGKVERPFRQLQETFLPEVEFDGVPTDLDDLNRRAVAWLDECVHAVESRTTGETPAARMAVEAQLLGGLPRVRFDTDYVEVRRVHNVLPFVAIDANRYSVPPDALGHKVEIRRKVNATTVEIRLAGRLIATHRLVGGRRVDVWDPEHRRAAEALALGWNRDNDRPDLRLIANQPEQPVERLELGGDYDIAAPDLTDPAAGSFAMLAEQARTENWSHIDFLARLIAEQATADRNRRLAARLRYAKFPFRRTIEEFDYEFQPSVDRKLVEDLATLRFIDENRPILFLGQPGCGKTHLAVALATLAVEAGYRGYFTTADNLCRTLVRASIEGNLTSKMKTFTAPTVLVIDDVGLLPIGGTEASSVFFQVVNNRYEKGHPTIVTTNRGLPDWGTVFGDTVVAAAVLDRLMHNAIVFNIKGQSWRLREHNGLEIATTNPTQGAAS